MPLDLQWVTGRIEALAVSLTEEVKQAILSGLPNAPPLGTKTDVVAFEETAAYAAA